MLKDKHLNYPMVAQAPVGRAGLATVVCVFLCISLFSTFNPSNTAGLTTITTSHTTTTHESIPNIIHFVHLRMFENSTLHFGFDEYLAMYSASYHNNPDTFYIHTDFSPEEIEDVMERKQSPDDKWTQLVFSIPNLHVNYVKAPTVLPSGQEVFFVEHKADFVRMDVVHEYGGMYMDTDIFTLRDQKPLRESGYNNIVGRQNNGLTSNGIFMARPHTAMMDVWIRTAYEIFDGGWDTAGSGLLTRIAERLTIYPNDVLILDEKAWAPTSWKEKSVNKLLSPNLEQPDQTETTSPESTDPYEWFNKSPAKPRDGEIDFSSSYAIHTFVHRGAPIDNFKGITPEYVFSRKSNFARAVYPAAKHAFNAGSFTSEDLKLL